jgi:AcrR family transcriptional regulator
MPRKAQFSKSDVISAAFELVKQSGWSGLSAAAVADKLGCSTMPIYSHFKNLEKLQDEVVKKGWELVKDYESRQFTGDAWIDQAIGYVRFSKKERRLFMCMFDGRNLELHREMLHEHWRHLSQLVEGYDAFVGLSEEKCMVIRYSRAMLSHGVATTVSMGYGEILEDDAKIADYLTNASHALLRGYDKDSHPGDKIKFSPLINYDALK